MVLSRLSTLPEPVIIRSGASSLNLKRVFFRMKGQTYDL